MNEMRKVAILTLMIVLTACGTHYRMTTVIHKNGTIERTVYALADSNFLAGDSSHNPFLFLINSDWELKKLDSCITFNSFGEEKKVNVSVGRTWKSAAEVSLFLPKEEWMRPFAAPREKMEKHFRWFYTYYTYTCKFDEITEKGPVPMNKYLSKEEQMLLFRGDMSTCQGMNGVELDEKLDDLTSQFQKWFDDSQFELSYEVVEHFLSVAQDTARLAQIKRDKTSVFAQSKRKEGETDCSPDVCSLLDKYYGITFFAEFYKTNEKGMEELYEEKLRGAEIFGNQMKFELTMPGKLLFTNGVEENNTLVWKVDGYRLLPSAYVLEAESRTINIWAFCATGLLIIFTGYVLIRIRRR